MATAVLWLQENINRYHFHRIPLPALVTGKVRVRPTQLRARSQVLVLLQHVSITSVMCGDLPAELTF
jgi:hypothetical protein